MSCQVWQIFTCTRFHASFLYLFVYLSCSPVNFRSSHQRYSIKRLFLKFSQNSQENTCVRVSFWESCRPQAFIKKETLAQVFSCQFCEIFKNTSVAERLWTTASDYVADYSCYVTTKSLMGIEDEDLSVFIVRNWESREICLNELPGLSFRYLCLILKVF